MFKQNNGGREERKGGRQGDREKQKGKVGWMEGMERGDPCTNFKEPERSRAMRSN